MPITYFFERNKEMLKAILVEDNPNERRTVSKTLKKINLNIELTACFDNGTDALNYLRTNKIDILISNTDLGVG